ncbi:hypothetical protein ACFYNL_26855 [Streptomyces sp. NPDC007808]|uniref:hypothetical protein n=1 Tax=Streptomyces sp. NPDC007808 TaxID=3364779 RepID=UPI0036D15FB4
MKLRHVRAVAVFVGVVVALTGARHSSGGGCDSSSNSSSSSSSSGGTSGGSTYGDDDDYGSSGGTGGGTESASAEPTADVRLESCTYDASRGIVARVKATNSSTITTYTYAFGVTFKDPDGAVVRTSSSTMPFVGPNSSDTLDVAAVYVPPAGESTTGVVTCVLDDVTRTAH